MGLLDNAQGVIFDCDGTLLDTLDAWAEAERGFFEEIGPISQEQEDEIHAVPIEEAARLFHDVYGAGESTEAVLDHLDTCLLDFYRNSAMLMPGVKELLAKLSDQGIPCVVLSSSPLRYVEAGLENADLRQYFKAVLTTDVYGVSKQDKRIYDAACEILGTTPGTTWGIDDAPYANKVLSSFGFHTIAPFNGCSDEHAALLRECAEHTVATLEELLD